jgi:hypothetical protein
MSTVLSNNDIDLRVYLNDEENGEKRLLQLIESCSLPEKLLESIRCVYVCKPLTFLVKARNTNECLHYQNTHPK